MTAVVQVEGLRVEAIDEQSAEPIELSRWAALLANGLLHEGITGSAEASVTFVEPAAIAELAVTYLDGDGSPTDVLAFPIDTEPDLASPAPRLVGDIVICPAYARTNAAPASLDDELALLVTHGLLHLVGHDHGAPPEAQRMKAREKVLLDQFYRVPSRGGS